MFEIDSVLHHCHEAAAMLTQPTGLVLPSASGVTSLARRVPHGVVGVISPFNFPLILSMPRGRAGAGGRQCGGAQARPAHAGQRRRAARAAVRGGRPARRRAARAARRRRAGEALVTDPDVTMISFTGSTAVGPPRRRARRASILKKVALELGGKNALIVLDDADLDLAVAQRRLGRVAAPGPDLHERRAASWCTSRSPPTYAERLAEKAKALPVGDPHTAAGRARPADRRAPSRSSASTASCGRRSQAGAAAARRRHLRRPVLPADGAGRRDARHAGVRRRDLRPGRRRSPASRTDDEAIALANDTEYGLSAGDHHRATSARGMALGERLNAGMVHINDQTVNDDGVDAVRRPRRLGQRLAPSAARPTGTSSPSGSGPPCAARRRPTRFDRAFHAHPSPHPRPRRRHP